ncbi:hypothetical protein [Helicobacter cinaedi]|uniref:hypothetical protein n=1 Tax=Helicobacter cinaedi TaxID=213 RepID=UPI000D7BF8A6|nr:hypothetical protein [Helicobacter cinaedi]BBB19595.1 hypothetical protein HC081234_07720 [Helicobacter cinaedi]
MSLQSNLKGVKEEFKSDEKLLENAFRLEILWRRYRKYVYVAVVCGAVGLGWFGISSYIQAQKAQEASAAYAVLMQDSENKEALESLQKASPNLYDMYMYFNANGDKANYEKLANSQNKLIKNLAKYEVATLNLSEKIQDKDTIKNTDFTGEFKSLENVEYKALRDLAILQEAYVLFQQDKIAEAHQKLMLIAENSPFAAEAMILKHYGLEDSAKNALDSQSQVANTESQATDSQPKP